MLGTGLSIRHDAHSDYRQVLTHEHLDVTGRGRMFIRRHPNSRSASR